MNLIFSRGSTTSHRVVKLKTKCEAAQEPAIQRSLKRRIKTGEKEIADIRGRITKIGSAHLRRALFMPAMSARVFNPRLKEFGHRLQNNGKKPKQIIVAIMRKLLHQIYGILKSREPYNPEKRGFKNSAKA